MLPITDHSNLDAERLETLAAQIQPLRSLEGLIGWAAERGQGLVDIIDQDEFTLDVLVPHDDRWLSFSCT